MITQREVAILRDVIKQLSGLDIPPDAALAALYAVADHNYRLVPENLSRISNSKAFGGIERHMREKAADSDRVASK